MSLGRRALLALWVGSGIYLSLIAVLVVCGLATLLIRSHGWSLLWLPAVLLPLPWLPLPVPAAFLLWLGPLASVDLGGARGVSHDARQPAFV